MFASMGFNSVAKTKTVQFQMFSLRSATSHPIKLTSNREPLPRLNGQNFGPSPNSRDLFPTTKYPEKELNAIIAKYHDDTAAIRHHMIEYGILERDAESAYWVSENVYSSFLMPEVKVLFEKVQTNINIK
jgi:hypothetical protein